MHSYAAHVHHTLSVRSSIVRRWVTLFRALIPQFSLCNWPAFSFSIFRLRGIPMKVSSDHFSWILLSGCFQELLRPCMAWGRKRCLPCSFGHIWCAPWPRQRSSCGTSTFSSDEVVSCLVLFNWPISFWKFFVESAPRNLIRRRGFNPLSLGGFTRCCRCLVCVLCWTLLARLQNSVCVLKFVCKPIASSSSCWCTFCHCYS